MQQMDGESSVMGVVMRCLLMPAGFTVASKIC